MLTKLLFVSVISLALAAPQHAPAAQYPAGVNPQDCPGFPICDNERLHNPHARWASPPAPAPAHAHAHAPAHAWPQPEPHWGAPAWQPAAPAWGAPAHVAAAPAAGGDKYPAGVNPHSCPNYPFCDVHGGGAHGAVAAPPLPGYTERLYPAGVSPHECPNFPYCH